MIRTAFRVILPAALPLVLVTLPVETRQASQALRGSCEAIARKSICTEYYDFTPGYVRDLCGMGDRTYSRGACPRDRVVGQCRLTGNSTFYYSTGASAYNAASARKHCTQDPEASWEG